MAGKRIIDLPLRTDVDATVNFGVDDASQTWRVTGAQVAEYVRGTLGEIGGGAIYVLRPSAGSTGDYQRTNAFAITAGSATAGATYSHNGEVFTVVETVSSLTQIVMRSEGEP